MILLVLISNTTYNFKYNTSKWNFAITVGRRWVQDPIWLPYHCLVQSLGINGWVGVICASVYDHKYVGIHFKIIIEWIESTPSGIQLRNISCPKLEIRHGEVFRKYHGVMSKLDLLFLSSLFSTACQAFSSDVFPRP